MCWSLSLKRFFQQFMIPRKFRAFVHVHDPVQYHVITEFQKMSSDWKVPSIELQR